MRWRENTCVHCAAYGAVPCTSALSCHVLFLCTGRCGASRWRKKLTSQPQGRDARSRTHRTVLYTPGALVQRRSRALRLYPSRIPWIASTVVCQAKHARLLSLDPRLSAFPVHGVGSTTLSLVKISRPINPTGIVGPLLTLEPLEKRDQKLYLQPTCNHTGRRNLREQLGHEPCSGETARDQEGTPEQLKAVPWDGALCRFLGRRPWSTNVGH